MHECRAATIVKRMAEDAFAAVGGVVIEDGLANGGVGVEAD